VADTERIDRFFAQQKHRYKIFVAGNHEMSFKGHSASEIRDRLPHVTYLQDSDFTIREGLKIYGSPWCGERGSPADAFTIPYSSLKKEAWSKIPHDVNILVTHCPPKNIMDDAGRTGCPDLRSEVFSTSRRSILVAHMFGHNHQTAAIHREDGIVFSNAAQGSFLVESSVPTVVEISCSSAGVNREKKKHTLRCNTM
jgi:hypothetical protein